MANPQRGSKQYIESREQILSLMRLGFIGLLTLFGIGMAILLVVMRVNKTPNFWGVYNIVIICITLFSYLATLFFGLVKVKAVPFVIACLLCSYGLISFGVAVLITPDYFPYWISQALPIAYMAQTYIVLIALIVYSVISLFVWKYKK